MDSESHDVYFQDLIRDKRLSRLLTAIEDYLGYKIKASQISDEHKKSALMSMCFSENGEFILHYDANFDVNQAVLCHELMHMVLWIEGWPAWCVDESLMFLPVQKEVMDTLKNLVLHLEVWPLVTQYGFDEAGAYNIEILVDSLRGNAAPPQWMHPDMALAVSAVNLAQGLLQPERQETKDEIRELAAKNIPQSLAVADSIVASLQSHLPLSPQGCLAAFHGVLEIIQAPEDILRPQYIANPCPGFRLQFFHESHKCPSACTQ